MLIHIRAVIDGLTGTNAQEPPTTPDRVGGATERARGQRIPVLEGGIGWWSGHHRGLAQGPRGNSPGLGPPSLSLENLFRVPMGKTLQPKRGLTLSGFVVPSSPWLPTRLVKRRSRLKTDHHHERIGSPSKASSRVPRPHHHRRAQNRSALPRKTRRRYARESAKQLIKTP